MCLCKYFEIIVQLNLPILFTIFFFPRNYTQNCKEYHPNDPTILASFTNGRLGNQMSSFATVYGLSKMSGNNEIRTALLYNQFKTLAHIFPYFEENFQKHLIHSWYCHHFCHLKWKMPRLFLQKSTLQGLTKRMQVMAKKFSRGHTFYVQHYLNIPLVYLQFYDELKNTIFKIRKHYLETAQGIINEKKKSKNDEKYSAVIGIHVRLTDYPGHLKLYNGRSVNAKFYQKAIEYFKKKYENPLFLVVSDNNEEASELGTYLKKN